MNSERPQNPKSDFPEAFDSDEMEIDVTYEEITPEEQLEIKKRVAQTTSSTDSGSEPLSDMWLDDNLEIIDIEQDIESESNSLNQEKVVENLKSKSTESEPLSDNSKVESSDSDREQILDSEESKLESEPLSDNSKVASSDSDREQILDSEESKWESEPTLDKLEINDSNSNQEEFEAKVDEFELVSDAEDELIEKGNEQVTPNEAPKLNNLTEQVFDSSEQELKDEDVSEELETIDKKSTDNQFTSSTSTTELIADSWLDESENISSTSEQQEQHNQELNSQLAELEQRKASLQADISNLQAQKEELIARQTQEIAKNLGRMVEEGTRELKERKNNLLVDIEKLERRRERIRQEMRTSFAGASQDLAVRVQGFKEYLVGSLQDLATAAERLDLAKAEERRRTPQREGRPSRETRRTRNINPEASSQPQQPQFTEQTFAEQNRRIRQLLERYRTRPDYYGSPWQLRRTFEPIHAERVQEWFFEQGGRGAIKGMGSRLQNILVASAVVSVLHRLYSDRIRILVLVDTPEKLGEWRRGLQDCLGVSRNDFGSNRGIVLFESADVLVQRAERLLKDKLLPIIIIDETEESVNLTLLKFPLWLAFAEQSQPKSSGYLY